MCVASIKSYLRTRSDTNKIKPDQAERNKKILSVPESSSSFGTRRSDAHGTKTS